MSVRPNLASLPHSVELRWFVRHGPMTHYSRGFRSKKAAADWIEGHQPDIEWRVGYLFRLYGAGHNTEIVNRRGEVAK